MAAGSWDGYAAGLLSLRRALLWNDCSGSVTRGRLVWKGQCFCERSVLIRRINKNFEERLSRFVGFDMPVSLINGLCHRTSVSTLIFSRSWQNLNTINSTLPLRWRLSGHVTYFVLAPCEFPKRIACFLSFSKTMTTFPLQFPKRIFSIVSLKHYLKL